MVCIGTTPWFQMGPLAPQIVYPLRGDGSINTPSVLPRKPNSVQGGIYGLVSLPIPYRARKIRYNPVQVGPSDARNNGWLAPLVPLINPVIKHLGDCRESWCAGETRLNTIDFGIWPCMG